MNNSKQQLLSKIDELNNRLSELHDTLDAIRVGAVDALIVSDEQGEKIYTLKSADAGYRAMAESMNEGAVILDSNGVIVFTNNAFSNLSGSKMPILLGTKLRNLIPATFQKQFASFLKKSAIRPYRAELSIINAKNGTIPVVISGTVFQIDERQNTCLIISDISEHKNAEIKLKNAYAEVEKKVVERTRTLKMVNDDLKQQKHDLILANKELESFSFSVSHDLRNPLNIITTNIEVLNIEVSAKPDSDACTAMTNIIKSTERMTQVITDLLTLSGISRQHMQIQSVNLSEMARVIMAELKHSAPNRVVEIKLQSNFMVNADPGLARILMENVLRNAWKFTSRKKRARIELGSVERDGVRYYFVRDNGIGIDMKDSVKVFRPYVRLQADQAFTGSGIGLAIAKRIAEKHGGKIWIEGEKDKSATIYFRFA